MRQPERPAAASGQNLTRLTDDSTMPVNITLKLFASLADHLPPGAVRNEAALTLPEARTVADLIADYNLPERLVHLVLVNGNFIGADARADHVLKDGDTLAIWPPIAGG